MDQPQVTTRFAPSPTGLLHLGNARTAYFNYLYARHTGGRFVIRSEDTDAERSREEFLTAAQADLRWLGLEWDAGPGDEGQFGPYRQSERSGLYAKLYRRLEDLDASYPCFCTPSELALSRKTQLAARRPPRYDGRCRRLAASERDARLARGDPAAIRFHVGGEGSVVFDDLVRGEQRFARGDIGDFIIRRADGGPAFFFGNAVDDALMGITHVLRGEDHLANTPRQILLLSVLDMTAPKYGHISLLVGEDGAPLSKRHGSTGLHALMDRGYLPSAVRNHLARLGHAYANDAWLSDDELAAGFELRRLGRSPARFDPNQLDHWQQEALNHASTSELAGWLDGALEDRLPAGSLSGFLEVVRHNLRFPGDASVWAGIVFSRGLELSAEAEAALRDTGPAFFTAALAALNAHGPDLTALTAGIKEATGAKGKRLFMPLRLAITGRDQGPELGPLIRLMPPDILRARLDAWALPR